MARFNASPLCNHPKLVSTFSEIKLKHDKETRNRLSQSRANRPTRNVHSSRSFGRTDTGRWQRMKTAERRGLNPWNIHLVSPPRVVVLRMTAT